MRASQFNLVVSAVMAVTAAAQAQPTPWQLGRPTTPQPPARASGQLGATAAPAFGQTATQSPSVTGQAPGQNLSVLGVPLAITAPVAAPYSNSAYGNLAGQPQRSGDELLDWRRDKD